ncbi:hypothetical protein WN55_11082 [Dufourea novaeangliae]|uniref:Uncharacterized protein n=1 Tax=Dufourea novaeangliae TaxID=178035 RepID=A0A154PBX1_DUFNO|nr:hypothetical protein WN55_11082 [Dufourea novaeangliae]
MYVASDIKFELSYACVNKQLKNYKSDKIFEFNNIQTKCVVSNLSQKLIAG